MELKYHRNNYWKLDFSEFPSRGILYKPTACIKIRPLNIKEVKFLSTMNPQNCSSLINEIIQDCCEFYDFEFNEMLLCDREYICFWLRCNSFIRNNGYTIHMNSCQMCNKPYDYKIELSDFETRYLYSMPNTRVFLPDCSLSIKIKIPKIEDLSTQYEEDETIEKIARYLDFSGDEIDRVYFVLNLSALDYITLKNTIESIECGFIKNLNITCPECGAVRDIYLSIKETGLFGEISLFDVMEIIIRITKYTYWQIADDVPWMELELAQEVVTKIAKEEQEEQEEINRKAKSSVSLHKPTIPKPSIPNNYKASMHTPHV